MEIDGRCLKQLSEMSDNERLNLLQEMVFSLMIDKDNDDALLKWCLGWKNEVGSGLVPK